MSIYKKDSNNEFQELFKKVPAMNWCKIMDGTSKFSTNFLVKMTMLLYKSKFPEFFQRCPLGSMVIEKVNMTIENKLIAMIPTGVYRVTLIFKYKNGKIMLFISLLIEIL